MSSQSNLSEFTIQVFTGGRVMNFPFKWQPSKTDVFTVIRNLGGRATKANILQGTKILETITL